MEKKAVSLLVYGKVQNVGFRYHTKEAAKRFGVSGFVQNKMDGTVYAEVEGESVAVDLFCEWCRKGPDWAKVSEVKISSLPEQGIIGFVIK